MKRLLRYIFPYICSVCEQRAPIDDRYICQTCLDDLPRTPTDSCPLCSSSFDSILDICPQCIEAQRPWSGGGAPLRFEKQSRELVHRFKYNSQLVISRCLIAEMVDYLKKQPISDLSLVTMVPLHWTRQFKRGYNQAEILARGIAQKLNLPCQNILKRKRRAVAQALKSKAQREKNITHIFNVPEKQKIPDGAILLVDDVMTTGATLTACTKALNEAGARRVYVLTAARG